MQNSTSLGSFSTSPQGVSKLSKRTYQICTRCVMDTSDTDIVFDGAGVCNHCKAYDAVVASLPKLDERDGLLDELVERIKASGRGKRYDCVIGVSGGVDSTYLAWLVKKRGLRPLAIHFDNGWNSETAVHNIQAALEKLEIDLITYVVDWEEFRDIQLSFLKASLSNPEHPTDHAIVATLYRTAARHSVKYIIVGSNTATEGVLPFSWVYNCLDFKLIKHVQKTFGTRKIKSFPRYNLWDAIWFSVFKGIKRVKFLDYGEYSRQMAIDVLERELGWRSYGDKHHESHYTRFCQQYVFPEKFSFDKKRAHLASLVLAGEITRDDALAMLSKKNYSHQQMNEDVDFVAQKLAIKREKFEEIIAQPPRSWWEYPNNYSLFTRLLRYPKLIRRLKDAR